MKYYDILNQEAFDAEGQQGKIFAGAHLRCGMQAVEKIRRQMETMTKRLSHYTQNGIAAQKGPGVRYRPYIYADKKTRHHNKKQRKYSKEACQRINLFFGAAFSFL